MMMAAGRCLTGPRSSIVALVASAIFHLPADATPGCNCPSRACCSDRKSSHFSSTSVYQATNEVWSPTCSFMNLDHGQDEPGGFCSDSYNGSFPDDRAVCDFFKDYLDIAWEGDYGPYYPPHVGVFIGPGDCEELTRYGEDCWWTYANSSWFAYWGKLGMEEATDCISGTYTTGGPSYSVGLQCAEEEQLHVVMKWVSAGSSPSGTICDMAGDIDLVINSTSWFPSHISGPRWQCWDLPEGTVNGTQEAYEKYRVYVTSMGPPPCSVAPTTTPKATEDGDGDNSTGGVANHGARLRASGGTILLFWIAALLGAR